VQDRQRESRTVAVDSLDRTRLRNLKIDMTNLIHKPLPMQRNLHGRDSCHFVVPFP